MNIMIPMAGLGSRFSSEGYRLPKPLINIVGRPMLFWLLDNLEFGPDDVVWVGIRQELGVEYAIEDRLRKEYPDLDLRVVSINFQTRGAAETLFIMLQHMLPTEVRRKVISLDCDTIYFSDVLGRFRTCAADCGCSFYFQDTGDKPIYSYISFEPGTQNIVHIREKVAISRHANTGAYAFPCGERLRNACCEVLDNPVGRAGEFYTSAIIDGMIRSGQKFIGIHVPSFACVGTPAQLGSFLHSVRTGIIKPRHRARICFDLDRSLLIIRSGNTPTGKPSLRPVERNVRLMQELKTAGHYIIVETYRIKLPPEEGSEDNALSGPGGLTLKGLQSLGIYYDQIVFGRPVADVYIDGRTTSRQCKDIEKEIGWCLHTSERGEVAATCADGFIAPRSFNRITCVGDKHIAKSAPLKYLRGERHFYRSIPPDLAHLFPALVDANDDPGLALPSMTITKIDGVSFSHLVTNLCVTRGRFAKLLRSLSAIHKAKRSPGGFHDEVASVMPAEEMDSHPAEDECAVAPACEPIQRAASTDLSPKILPPSAICANLHEKVLRRLELNNTAYAGFDGIDVPQMSQIILSYVRKYQEEARFRRTDFVHGDPVFSNCLMNKAGEVVFIDMRGALGDIVTTEGDINYDLSKVYQSLKGYDFMILDKELDPTATEMLRDLEETVFWPFVREHYAGTPPRDITMLAASHFLSIVPLHENRRHQARFLAACNSIIIRHDIQ